MKYLITPKTSTTPVLENKALSFPHSQTPQQTPKTLTLPVSIPEEERKLTYIFIFALLLCGASKGFIKAFIKPYEAPQRSVKLIIYVV